jgi:hypothetical protein
METKKDKLIEGIRMQLKYEAKDVIENFFDDIDQIFNGKRISKSKYKKTIQFLSGCCRQLMYGFGFCQDKPIQNVTPDEIYLTLSAFGIDDVSIQERISEDGHHKCQASFFRIVENNSEGDVDNEESTIYFDYCDEGAYEDVWKLVKCAVDDGVFKYKEKDDDGADGYSNEEDDDDSDGDDSEKYEGD